MTPTPEQFRRLAEAMADARIARNSGIHIPIRGRGYLVEVLVNDLAAAWPIAFPVDPNAVTVRIAVGIPKDRTHGFVVQACGIDDADDEESAMNDVQYEPVSHLGIVMAHIPPVRIPEVPASVEGV
jgi:hypothetical protein